MSVTEVRSVSALRQCLGLGGMPVESHLPEALLRLLDQFPIRPHDAERALGSRPEVPYALPAARSVLDDQQAGNAVQSMMRRQIACHLVVRCRDPTSLVKTSHCDGRIESVEVDEGNVIRIADLGK